MIRLLLVLVCLLHLAVSIPRGLPNDHRLRYESEMEMDERVEEKTEQLEEKSNSSTSDKMLICYYTNWSQYRPTFGDFYPADIDGNLCTHIHFAFAYVKLIALTPSDKNDKSTDSRKGTYEQVTDIKKRFPNLKILLSVGGWNQDVGQYDGFSAMVADKDRRHSFILDTSYKLRTWHFDGLVYHWEYPGSHGSPLEDKHRFTLLVQETRALYEHEAHYESKPRLLVAADVAAIKPTIDAGYEVQAISESLDYISIMSYDFYTAADKKTGHPSPLLPPDRAATDEDFYLNMDFAVDYWLKLGCPKNKLAAGLITYGRSFTLADPSDNGLRAPVIGPGEAGRLTETPGLLSFDELTTMKTAGGTEHFLLFERAPYMVLGDQWVGYENKSSLIEKVRYIKGMGLAGAMVWSLDLDDFTGHFTGQGSYPLIRTIREELYREEPGKRRS